MYTSALFTAILAGSALALHPVQELVRRQTLTNDIIPAACQDTCSSSLPIYNACLSGDQTTCLTVCDEANFDPFVACFNCIIQNVPGGSSGQFQEAQQLIGELESACQQDGSSVGSASLSSASGASGASSAAAASFTSASSGITIGGGSSTGGLASITSSVAAGASSASQAVAGSSTPSASQSGASAAASSPNAGVITAPTGIFAVILGAIGALAL